MAFFTNMRAEVPLLPPDLDLQDTQCFGQTVMADKQDEDDNDSGSDCEITDDVISRRLQILEKLIENDENDTGILGNESHSMSSMAGTGGDISKNSTLKHSDFAELPLSPSSLPPPPPSTTTAAEPSLTPTSSRSSTTPTKGSTPPVTVTVNGEVQIFSTSPPSDLHPPPPPPDYSDDICHNLSDYDCASRTQRGSIKSCDLYVGDGIAKCDSGTNAAGDESVNSSGCSTPTPTSGTVVVGEGDNSDCATANDERTLRFDYEIDPDIGVIV